MSLLSFGSVFKICRQFCTKPVPAPKQLQVCILGADTRLGRALAFLMKQNPAISGLHLQGTPEVEAMGFDFSHFDTRCRVKTHFENDSVKDAVTNADIVVMLGLSGHPFEIPIHKLVMIEGQRFTRLTTTCIKYAPKAVVIVAVTPVSVMLPIAAELYRQSDWYHPGKLLGSAALAQVKANTLAARFQDLDPAIVHVPILAGPDLDCAVPLFTHALPVEVSKKKSTKLLEEFRGHSDGIVAQAVGLNRMVGEVAKGLKGDGNAKVMAFVRNNFVGACRHSVCTVQVGKSGVVHNYGLNKLSREDLMHVEEMCVELKRREDMASQFVHRKDESTLPPFLIEEMEKEKEEKLGVIR